MTEKLKPSIFEQVKATIIVFGLGGVWLGLSFLFPPLFIVGVMFIEGGSRAFTGYGRYDGDSDDSDGC
jgi:hypothetical protein